MAPKRKAAVSATKAGRKKVKEEPDAPKDAFMTAKEALKASAPQGSTRRKADSHFECQHTAAQVYEDYDCMLNQTNVGQNNNKFYLIQVLQTGNAEFFCWTRWGRVGEVGAFAHFGSYSQPEKAIEVFEKKFKDKTKNKWSDRASFVSHPGKYTLIEVDGEQDAELKVNEAGLSVVKNILPCSLDKPTQKLVNLIFSNDMFKKAMECMNLDIKKMPLGKLSKAQIAKGFEALEELEEALKKKSKKADLEALSSKFFTIIPHNFGRKKPPIIDTSEILKEKKDMLLVVADIEIAQGLKAESEKVKEEMIEDVPHPDDQNYMSLNCKLCLLDKNTEDYKIIETYMNSTGDESYLKLKLAEVWKVDRGMEAERFQENEALENRRLLWHGTNVAVVAAILKNGLRIMPQSGGRVGKGIYFASENRKSAGYVYPSNGTGVMFLNEVCLGKEYTITRDDSSLKKAPEGYDSVVARGQVEPDASKDTFITLDGKKVTVPQGEAIDQPQFKDSYFYNSEYLVYKENQCRIRYLLEVKFPR